MNRTATRIALTTSAVLLGGAAVAPAAMASSAYPPATPPTTTTVVPAVAQPAAPAPAVRASVSEPTVASLAYTGAEVGAVGALGLGLVVAGAALVRSGRRAPSAG